MNFVNKIAAAVLAVFLSIAVVAPAGAAFGDQATWGGTSGGSANAQTLTIANYPAPLPGVAIRFIAGYTNTGAATLAVSGYSAISVYRTTPSGPSALIGGEIVAGQLTTVVYDGTRYQLQVNNALPVVAPPQGRLTLTSGVPVLSSDVTAASTIYYTPYLGGALPVFNGVGWIMTPFSELPLTLNNPAHAANTNYDVFVADDSGGTMRLCTGPAWSSNTARGTGAGTTQIAISSGFYSNAVSITCRYGATTFTVAANYGLYVGSFRTTSTAGQTAMMFLPTPAAGGTANQLLLWNMYNRVSVASTSRDSTDTWTYSTATWRAADASGSNRVSAIVGLNEDAVVAQYYSLGALPAGLDVTAYSGVGVDSTSAIANGSSAGQAGKNVAQATTTNVAPIASYSGFLGLGFHYVQALEYVSGSLTTWYGDNGAPTVTQSTLSLSARM
jgi:hypothetical protein